MIAVGLALLLAVAVAVIALLIENVPPPPAVPAADGPLALPAIPAPAAELPECRTLLASLPETLATADDQLHRRPLAEPQPAGVAAWGSGESPVVLRCGIERPAELTRTAALLDVSGVRWLRLAGSGSSSWIAVDRPVYVAITFADSAGTGPLQDVSTAIDATLPAQRVQPAG